MVLGLAFAVAVWMRIQSYDADVVPAVAGATAPEQAQPDAPVDRAPADPGYILEADASMTTGAPHSATREREQRYNELLRNRPAPASAASPPTVVPASPPEERSLLTRVAEAVGIRPKPQPEQKPAATRPPPAQPRPADADATKSSSGRNEPSQRKEEVQDEDSDVIPPQILAAEFAPNVLSGGDSTTFIVVAQDNLAGVRSVSGVIANPTGMVTGFACQREGDTNRFVTKITIPKEAPSGQWHVKYMTITDNASNRANLNFAQGQLPPTVRFTVSSPDSDSTAPLLRDVRLDNTYMRAGERNTLFVQAEDDKSGVSMVSGVFVSPGSKARLSVGCREGTPGTWDCPVQPPKCLDCGSWRLEQVQLVDKANNLVSFRAENQLVGRVALEITGDSCDGTPPALITLSLNPTVVSNTEGGIIEVKATIADEGCGTASLSGQAIPPGGIGGQVAHFSLRPTDDPSSFLGTMSVPKNAARGTWTIAWMQAMDKGHNMQSYAANDPVVSRVTFQVE